MTRHSWMVLVPYEVTDEDARRVSTGEGVPSVDEVPSTQLAGDESPAPTDARPFLGLHNARQDLTGVVCWDCEQPWTAEVAAQPCPGSPGGKLAYVDDEGRDLHPDEVEAPPTPPGAAGSRRPVGFGGVGRNDPCPCGSGLKFKRCHGA